MPKKTKQSPRLQTPSANPAAAILRASPSSLELSPGRRVVLEPEAGGEWFRLRAEADDGAPVLSLQCCGPEVLRFKLDAQVRPIQARPELDLSIQKAYKRKDGVLPRKGEIKRWAQAALERDAVVTVRFVDEDEGRSLNRDYRGKDYATNVLTFVYGEGEPLAEEAKPAMLEGDLVLCVPVVMREAEAQGKTAEAHYAHLIVHGMLHLQGYDHEVEEDAVRMEATEARILGDLGYPNPYAEE